jgi:HEAT repeat protein
MGDPVSERTVVENPRLWHAVEVVREWPDFDATGRASARMRLDVMLLQPEGMTPEDREALRDDEVQVLRLMATQADPAFGVTHQVAAIGALAENGDTGALLLLAELARKRVTDERVRIAAINALGEIGGPGVDSVVRDLIRDRQPSIQLQAVWALAKVGTAADVSTLEELIREGDDQVAPVARRAAQALRLRMGMG